MSVKSQVLSVKSRVLSVTSSILSVKFKRAEIVVFLAVQIFSPELRFLRPVACTVLNMAPCSTNADGRETAKKGNYDPWTDEIVPQHGADHDQVKQCGSYARALAQLVSAQTTLTLSPLTLPCQPRLISCARPSSSSNIRQPDTKEGAGPTHSRFDV